jgi:RNase H-like domain found in reverse transcriptase/Reverse transcriptase (RNA-dependent DNA polymerase)
MGDLSSCLDGCVIFSKLDLQKGYFQVPVAGADVPKTAVIMPFDLFEFVRMPFGLKNAGMTFQRLMDRIFFDLPYSFVYLDDLLVASRSVEDHRRHLREVLRRLQENGLVVNRDKCVFGQRQVEFLGHTIAAGGVSPLPDRVAAIRRFPRPSTVQELQAFLGLFNFYRRFVPAAAAILRPLTDALSGSPSGTAAVPWSAASMAAFEAARAALADTALLDHPAADSQLSLVTDASATHVGAALQQRRRGQGWRPLGFFSQKLSPAETRYSTFDRELLAIYSSILHFRHLLEGRSFVIFTDHLPLVGAIGRVSDPRSDRQWRQLSFIAEFLTEICHISGPSNVVADALSRPAPDPAADGCRCVEAQLVVAGRWGPPSGPLAGSTPVVAAAGLRHHPGSSLSSAVGELPSCAAAAALLSVPAGVAAGSEACRLPEGRLFSVAASAGGGHERSPPAGGSVVGRDAPASPAAVSPGHYSGCTWPGARWHQGHQENDSEPLFVAQSGEGCRRLVPQLPGVPAGECDGPAGGGGAAYCGPNVAVFTCSHRYRGASSVLSGWFFLRVNGGGPVYQVGRSSTAEGHRRRRLR